MGDIKLPEPFATNSALHKGGELEAVPVYTAEQAEAYAEARAKQAAELERERCAATIRALFANRVGTAEWAGYAEAFIRLADEAIRSRGTK